MSTTSLSTAALSRPARWLAVGAAAALLVSLLPAAVLGAPPVGTQLAFSAQPAGGVVYGSLLPTQPKVEIRDAGGNLVTSGPDATAAVTLAISPGTPAIGGPGALACTATTVNAVAGVATFGGCRINTNSGAGYKLRAGAALSGGGVTRDSNPFSISSLTPAKLVFSTQPGGGTGGVEWLNQPVLQVQDVFNQVAVQVNGTATVTVAIAASPGPGTLTCGGGLSRTVILGVATFTGCKIDRAGIGYRLRATSSLGFTFAVTSSPFSILAGPAVKLAFLRQPAGDVPYGTFLPVQPIVAIQDLGGNTVTTGADSGRAVYLSIAPGTPSVGGPGAVACFASPVFAVGGVAAFSGCRINTNSGLGYRLRASAVLGGIAVIADSTPFDIYSMAPVKLAFTGQPGGGTGGTPWDAATHRRGRRRPQPDRRPGQHDLHHPRDRREPRPGHAHLYVRDLQDRVPGCGDVRRVRDRQGRCRLHPDRNLVAGLRVGDEPGVHDSRRSAGEDRLHR